MLVLSRKKGQEILIRNDVRVTVLEVKNGKVRLGITAPDDVHILRQEIPKLSPLTQSHTPESLEDTRKPLTAMSCT